jgi:DNA recombination protein RmuC
MQATIAFGLGVLAGIVTYWLASRLKERDTAALAQELVRQADSAKTREVELLASNMRDSVKALTSDLISGGVRQLADASGANLDSRKALIDQSLQSMNEKLEQVSALVTNLNTDRERKFGELTSQLVSASSETTKLRETTEQLRSILSSPAARGQWGERMAEDVLRAAGLVEGINYRKQVVSDESGTRPDFTFLLPNDLVLNMDVKFPLNGYLAYLDCGSDDARKSCAARFVRDVRDRIREASERDYIDAERGTVDYVLLFVPNERVLSFLNECDASVIDDALKRRVVICSPFTLYAVLVVIRQAVDNFNFERATSEMLDLLAGFNKQWEEFVKAFDGVEAKIEGLQDAFAVLSSTRRKKLDSVLAKIDEVRLRQGAVADTAVEVIGSP